MTTTDPIAFATQFLQTPLNAIAVKRINFRLGAPTGDPECGKLSVPGIIHGSVKSNTALYEAIRASGEPEVVVVGHGWEANIPGEVFVWRGSVEEFEETWEGD